VSIIYLSLPSYVALSAAIGPTTTSTTPVTTTTTTSTTSTTSTTLPPSTTTTTTTAPTTTTHPSHVSTTTKPSTTTTTTKPPATHHQSTSTPWGLIALIVVLVLAIALVTVLLVIRRARTRQSAWRRAVLPALSDARLARDALLSGNAESDDDQLRAAVGLQVERAATALEGTVDSGPEPEDADAVRSVASSLRGLAFAIEADRLLRHGASAPSGAQLAEADMARRDRGAELDRAIARLAARVGRGTKRPAR
jgi:hypothetical protein